MKVKICGITSLESALFAAESGADALGFVFANSKRHITPERARDIIKELPSMVWKVGVFVNEDAETVQHIAKFAGLTHIQLHGQEKPEEYAELKLPIIKSISVFVKEDIEKTESLMADYLLLDSPPGKYVGGNGVAFDWNLAHTTDELQKSIILAGGLTPENVSKAIRMINPYMVDVSSGVETAGIKDPSKIRTFIANAKRKVEELRDADKNI